MVGMADNAAEFNMNKVKTFYANMYGASLTGYEKDSIVKTVLHMLYLKKSICKFKVHTFKVFLDPLSIGRYILWSMLQTVT